MISDFQENTSNKERVPLSFKLYAPTRTKCDRVKLVGGLVDWWVVC